MADMSKYSTQGPYGLKKCYDGGSAIVDIVFVHGLTGNRESTWTDKSSGTFWPETLLKNDIPEARILTFGYDADVLHFFSMASQNRIGNHSQNLANVLSQLRERSETNDRPIIFVAHSLGGLVVEDALLASKNSAEPHIRKLLECTVALAFLGTPHCGSDLANWAKVFGHFTDVFKKTNTDLLGTLKPDSEVLARIQQEFHMMIRARRDDGKSALFISCFFEELPMKGVGVIVPMHSAILPGYNAIGIRNNHSDMTKFVSEEDPGYLAVSNELWRWVKGIKSQLQMIETSRASSQTPAMNQNQQRWPTVTSEASQDQQQRYFQGNYIQQGQLRSAHWPGSQHEMIHNNYNQNQNPLLPAGSQHDFLPPLPAPERRVIQEGNTIGDQNISGGGKVVQANNIRSDKDVTFNF